MVTNQSHKNVSKQAIKNLLDFFFQTLFINKKYVAVIIDYCVNSYFDTVTFSVFNQALCTCM